MAGDNSMWANWWRGAARIARASALAAAAAVAVAAPTEAANSPAPAGDAIVIGLDADMSKDAAQGGEAIRRGAVLAIEEINSAGGVLGRPLALMVKDHRANPARGIDNIAAFAEVRDLVAVLGGVHTPVAMAELEAVHANRIPFLIPWAAGTPVIDNEYDPNFAFRVSVRDEFAGGFLVDAARKRGFRRLGLLLWRTGWGRSNERAISDALAAFGAEPAGVRWMNTGQKEVDEEIGSLIADGAEAMILVTNPIEGRIAIEAMARRKPEDRIPIISHWGITGGDFHVSAGESLKQVDLTFLQTFSFFDPPFPDRAEPVMTAYCDHFGGCGSPADVVSPVGTAHAYDLVHLLARAVAQAGSTDRDRVRDELEKIDRHEGLVRDYDPPFEAARHDALDRGDFILARFGERGSILPISEK